MAGGVSAGRRLSVGVDFGRMRLGLETQIGRQHQHEGSNDSISKNRVNDRKDPTESVMAPRRIRGHEPNGGTRDQAENRRNIPADSRNLERLSARRAHEIVGSGHDSHCGNFRQRIRTGQNCHGSPPRAYKNSSNARKSQRIRRDDEMDQSVPRERERDLPGGILAAPRGPSLLRAARARKRSRGPARDTSIFRR